MYAPCVMPTVQGGPSDHQSDRLHAASGTAECCPSDPLVMRALGRVGSFLRWYLRIIIKSVTSVSTGLRSVIDSVLDIKLADW